MTSDRPPADGRRTRSMCERVPLLKRRTGRGIAALRSLGYRVRVMPHALDTRSRASASVTDRVADLEEAFKDPDIAAVLATIGGNHSAQLLSQPGHGSHSGKSQSALWLLGHLEHTEWNSRRDRIGDLLRSRSPATVRRVSIAARRDGRPVPRSRGPTPAISHAARVHRHHR